MTMKIDAASERSYLSLAELSRKSGLSEVTLRRWWRAGTIVGFQPGGPGSRLLFPHDTLERNPAEPSSLKPETRSSDMEPAKSAATPTQR